ncbi:bifunctional diguanylate cyclase/phosphodiesterase [Clostridium sp. YIM B02506]|uniref:putative bifunctional diguanylate cyclase/phosphodiesterase n=1 Tax=Clostridium sp. YIM B02506 TaxID=2910680 RepID=UPI001EEE8F07|nr:bifunctional diguanylate cyclase/phosphodiesterase [Clostridium sp. YIM B02506]
MFKNSFNLRKVKKYKDLGAGINPRKEALKIALVYLILGVFWIKTSDFLLEKLAKDNRVYWAIQTYKGWIYVLITMCVIYILIAKKILLLEKAFVELNNSNRKLDKLAYYDTLSNLPNSAFFKLTVNELIDNKNIKNNKFALVYIDIDDFKNINNTLGYTLGDKLIIYISNILKYQVKEEDFASRFGGDEFTILFTNIEKNVDVVYKIEELLNILRRPWKLEGQEFFISYSVGIAIYKDHGSDFNELLKNANTAMFEVKRRSKNGYTFYNHDMEKRILEKINLINEMKHAIGKDEFMLYYQPIIRLEDNTVYGFEALIRWYKPNKGFISPMNFIPLSEEIGYIDPISRWVLKSAFEQIKEWRENGVSGLVIGINISGKLLINDDIVDYIAELLDLYKIDSKSIKLEITETAIMTNLEEAIKVLRKMRSMGLQLSLDDFGTGYSSLTYLKKLPMNMVKLDKEFINNIFSSDQDKIVVESVINLIKDLKLKIVAEGIETKEQLDFLKNNQCDFGQGYYFSKPVPKDECIHIITNINCLK